MHGQKNIKLSFGIPSSGDSINIITQHNHHNCYEFQSKDYTNSITCQ